ncbi:hypothetical protein [Sedimentibacter sp. MB31-C6]|uniref:hypothetical protein n=1 Tax=Sedimentibacter sp. MB31-C6 TaxID=3109366 RepID=UPI002DDCC205|nr:hypothetical protein [Sedimentibacter sp. MB36-C1]WSI05176.1 hypothetical protein U8307_05130 [Sedimentibacter sp. MB36-C1]
MDSCKHENIVEVKDVNEDINAQHDYGRGPINQPCVPRIRDRVAGDRGIDSSLLFFFLILVCIVCQCDTGIELDTLLWFFLLLVVLYQFNFDNGFGL